MYEKYLEQIEEAGKIRNLTQSTINSYRNFVSSFLTYMNKNPEELTCQDVRRFLLEKKDAGLKASTLNHRNILYVFVTMVYCVPLPRIRNWLFAEIFLAVRSIFPNSVTRKCLKYWNRFMVSRFVYVRFATGILDQHS